MEPMLTRETLEVIAQERPLADLEWADYCIENASREVARLTGHRDWLGIGPTGLPIEVVAPDRDAVMVAEQIAARAYLNPRSIIAEGGIGPIGGDRYAEEFAKAFQPTDWELSILAAIAERDGTLPMPRRGGLSVVNFEVRGKAPLRGDIRLPDVDPRAEPWPMGTVGGDYMAYGQV